MFEQPYGKGNNEGQLSGSEHFDEINLSDTQIKNKNTDNCLRHPIMLRYRKADHKGLKYL